MAEDKVNEGAVKVSDAEVSGISADKKTPEDARRWLAYIYVSGFLGIVVLVLILSFINGFVTNDVKDLLLTTSGILSGPLGFIIGYYFKSKEGV